ncbi:MAG TPA: PaaI family thioesterase [Acidimicrobiales bacterium]|nr:PaaI family thioesterase [Acidimicrobiales bacterium]
MTAPTDTPIVMDAVELNRFLGAAFPGAPRAYRVTHVDAAALRMRVPHDTGQLRPGGTVSGPTMMGLADAAAWLVTLSRIGPVALAVTSSFTIHFLTRPTPTDLWAEAVLLRLGRRQSVSEVRLWSEGGDPSEPVAHATVTYAIPPEGSPARAVTV